LQVKLRLLAGLNFAVNGGLALRAVRFLFLLRFPQFLFRVG